KITNSGLTWKLTADYILYDSITNKWQINNYFIREIDGLNEKISKGQRLDTLLKLKPEDFSSKVKNVDIMGYNELRKFIADEYLKGSENVKFYEVEKHKRIAFPFATIILTLIGVSLSSHKSKGGTGVHLGIGITISFAFILFMQISSTFATNGNLPPALAVWIPNILFFLLSLYLLYIAPK
ncbi:MAG TPA: LptF/LptG family permease, partial [Bacteroidales bacterium]|nr:LptF/LptG family permease [Bacteroidales bacterium]